MHERLSDLKLMYIYTYRHTSHSNYNSVKVDNVFLIII